MCIMVLRLDMLILYKPGVLKTAAKDSLPNTYLIRFT